jgi:hypothetical protein
MRHEGIQGAMAVERRRRTTDRHTATRQLLPHAPGAVGLVVVCVHRADDGHERLVAVLARRRRPLLAGVVAAHTPVQGPADRLDPEARAVRVDEAHRFGRIGSSSRAKYALAALRISFARRSSLFSLRNAAISLALRARQAVTTLTRVRLGLTHPRTQRLLVNTQILRDMRDRTAGLIMPRRWLCRVGRRWRQHVLGVAGFGSGEGRHNHRPSRYARRLSGAR